MKKHYSFVQEAESFLGLKFGLTDDEKELLADKLWKEELPDNKKWNSKGIKSITNATHIGGRTGGIIGAAGGAKLGDTLSRKLFKVNQRRNIKKIILSSDSPEDCIKKLKELGTPLALKYCDAVNEAYKKYPNSWKHKLSDSINIKNITAQTVGSIGGMYAGNRLGHLGGIGIGSAIGCAVN
jgi:hypothetical protein